MSDDTEKRIRGHIDRIREIFTQPQELTEDQQREVAVAATDLLGTALVDLHRIANAADRIRGR